MYKMIGPKDSIIFTDYPPVENCKNEYSYGSSCLKCNKCGRFDEIREEDSNEDCVSTRKRESKDIRK